MQALQCASRRRRHRPDHRRACSRGRLGLPGQLELLLDGIEHNLGRKLAAASAGSGYPPEANLATFKAREIDGHIACARSKHDCDKGNVGGPLAVHAE